MAPCWEGLSPGAFLDAAPWRNICVVLPVRKSSSPTHWDKPSWLPGAPRSEGHCHKSYTFATVWKQNTSQSAELISAQPSFCSLKTLCMLCVLLPQYCVIRHSYLPWIMHWIPKNTDHPTGGNLVRFKWAQLANLNSFCCRHVQLKNIYIMLSFGGFELQVQLSHRLCFCTQMRVFYFPMFLLFSLVKDHCTCLTAEHISRSPSQSPCVLILCQSLHWSPWFHICKYQLGISQAALLKQFQNPPYWGATTVLLKLYQAEIGLIMARFPPLV